MLDRSPVKTLRKIVQQQPGGATIQVKTEPVVQTESQTLTPGGMNFIDSFLRFGKKALQAVIESPHKDNNYFSPLKPPSFTTAALLAQAAAKKLEEEKQRNLEEVEAAKKFVGNMDISPELKREMLNELSRTDVMGKPLSQAGMALFRYAQQGKDKAVQEFEYAKQNS